MNSHSFSVELAIELGVEKAIILQHLWFWHQKNKANEQNYHDGAYWTYNTAKAFNEIFPYIKEKKIYSILKSLEEDGFIKTGNYNKVKFDRTKWYALTEIGISIFTNEKLHFPKLENPIQNKENPITENGEPIPDNKPNNKPDLNTDIKQGSLFENKKNKRPEIVLPFTSKEFIELWDVWKKYKQQQHRFKYKSKITEQAALNKLFKLSNGDEDLAKKIIMQSIDNGWKGLFAYKGEIKHDPLHNLLKETFISEYQKITGNEYLWTERDDKPISELIDKIRYAYKTSKRNPVENPIPEQMKKGLLYLIGRAANDSWMAANLEPRILNNKFNNLMNNKNGKNGISNVVAQVLNELNI